MMAVKRDMSVTSLFVLLLTREDLDVGHDEARGQNLFGNQRQRNGGRNGSESQHKLSKVASSVKSLEAYSSTSQRRCFDRVKWRLWFRGGQRLWQVTTWPS